MIAQVGGVLHRGDDAAAAHSGQLVFQTVDHRSLGTGDAGEQFSKLECGDLQHGAPCRENPRRC